MMLFGFTGISSCWAAYCVCESLFMIHHGVYFDVFVCPTWFIDKLEIHHNDRSIN